jgi:hypothetical protein
MMDHYLTSGKMSVVSRKNDRCCNSVYKIIYKQMDGVMLMRYAPAISSDFTIFSNLVFQTGEGD